MDPTADGGGTVGAGDPGTGRRPDQTDRGRAEPGGGGHSAPGEGEPATGKAPPPTRTTLLPLHTPHPTTLIPTHTSPPKLLEKENQILVKPHPLHTPYSSPYTHHNPPTSPYTCTNTYKCRFFSSQKNYLST